MVENRRNARRSQESIGPKEFFVTKFQIAVFFLLPQQDINETTRFEVCRSDADVTFETVAIPIHFIPDEKYRKRLLQFFFR